MNFETVSDIIYFRIILSTKQYIYLIYLIYLFCMYSLYIFLEVNEPHEGLRKTESQWPVHQINWQKTRYIYDLYYTYEKISKEVYDYCVTNKIIDAALIAKWKKRGYERLCSTYTINPRNYKFGTVSICRVPKQYLAPGMEIEDPITGCRGCASGSGGSSNIFGNKYGQYLAAIQVAREERIASKLNDEDSDDEDDERDETQQEAAKDQEPVGAKDGSSGKLASVWAADDEKVELSEDLFGVLDIDAEKEARAAAKHASKTERSSVDHAGGGGGGGSSAKRVRF